ncbi:hypothetical protein FXV83_22220 [Bradyrhizobium hipponense]|uniref:Uncharacterized protein n=1 Tax=Bradyrhizobium hipponense TaxID=2605638 RepID=A0A5S4YJ91_9BRAD|nr:hypothetical protein [Bradyrhizobium hipponense]TYO64456.1 hypothetical protein FXV83_22220 [Bradyrhizobium hipponense]
MSAIWQWPVERGEIITDTSFETRIRVVVDQLLTLIGEGRSIENLHCHFIERDSSAGLKSIAASHMLWRLATHPPPH